MFLDLLPLESSYTRTRRAYLEQVQCNRHGLQLPKQIHGSLLEGKITSIKDI